MELLLITSGDFFSTYGGGQVYVKNIVNELINQGIYPSIATSSKSVDIPPKYRGCKIYNYNSKACSAGLISIINKIKPDIVHAHGNKALVSKTCSKLKIPCIVTAHHGGILCPAGALLNHKNQICRIKANHSDCLPCVLKGIRSGSYAFPLIKILPLHFRLYLGRLIAKLPFMLYFTPVCMVSFIIQKKFEEWKTICQLSNIIIAPSNAIAESMIQNGANKNKITIIPHGIPLPKTTPNIQKDTITSKRPIQFFFLGRISHEKGLHILLQAFAKIKGNIELHIVGGTGNKDEQRYHKRLIKKYKSDNRIFWHGKIKPDKVNQKISKFDIMIHPSICMEIFGLNIAEALSMGKPVIATRCGGAEMQIQHNQNGWLVEPNNVASLLAAMNVAMDSLSSEIGQVKHISATVNRIEQHVSDILYLYKKVTSLDQ